MLFIVTGKNKKYHVKGFTLAEVLITLALTSLAITLSYSTLTYIQKLFYNYKEQNKFINEYTDLKKRMDLESLKASTFIENSENNFTIKRDSSAINLQILEKVILLKKATQCDTFHIVAKKITKEYEFMKNPLWANKLIKSLTFEVEFTKQKFNFYFYKNYDAAIKLELDKEE
ncbi:MAG: prepilin-type N-terminal cleavage/methylation domain-containing protein [Bacteroidetes bacterium]|nr:prepilin-type N-terminal cleavage/methylation domain-containing protein [Bacteroidota bacterium]